MQKVKVMKQTKSKKIINNIGIFIIISILISGIWIKSLQAGFAYDETLDTNNHNYPVYLVLTMELNNKTSEGLVASTTIFNETTNKWTTNHAMLDQIQTDLNKLPTVINDLKQATIFDYNITYQPGCVYILLSPEKLSLAGKVTNQTIDYVLNHSSLWWYVSNVAFETIDLHTFLRLDMCLDVFNIVIGMATPGVPVGFRENDSIIPNPEAYDIINNTIIPRYYEREGIKATMLVYNGTDWVLNYPFVLYLNETLTLINEQPIFRNNEVFLFTNETNYEYVYEQFIDGFESCGWNVTPIINENTTNDDIIAILSVGRSFWLDIIYDSDYSYRYQSNNPSIFEHRWSEVLQFYITLWTLVKHLWFCTEQNYFTFSGSSSASLSFYIFPLSFIVLSLPCVLVFRNRKILKR